VEIKIFDDISQGTLIICCR